MLRHSKQPLIKPTTNRITYIPPSVFAISVRAMRIFCGPVAIPTISPVRFATREIVEITKAGAIVKSISRQENPLP